MAEIVQFFCFIVLALGAAVTVYAWVGIIRASVDQPKDLPK